MKRFFCLILLCAFLFSFKAYSQSNICYKIDSVVYNPSGITKVSALERLISFDINKTFSTEEELVQYTQVLEQQLQNTRLFENIQISIKEVTDNDSNQADETRLYEVTASFDDSNHILCLPKAAYNSNTGAEAKIKLKDTNFFGLTNTLGLDANINLGTEEFPEDFSKITTGINFSYDLPFNVKNILCTWENDFTFSWLIGNNAPDFSYETGVLSELPVNENVTFSFEFLQTFSHDNDYTVYNDDLYASEYARIFMPVILSRTSKNSPVKYTPSLSVKYFWDADGLSPANTDFSSPVISAEHSLTYESVNWYKNFRKGFSLAISQGTGWNFSQNNSPSFLRLETQFFSCWKNLSLCFRNIDFYKLNQTEKTGSYIRGTRDNQQVLKTQAAIIFNLDLPVKLFATRNLGLLNFELQFSPFFDTAFLLGNKRFYNAGAEVLVYPEKWKSFVVRLSAGYNFYSTEDSEVKPYEIYFGLGRHF